MSPLCVEILLWHYGRADQYPEWNRGIAQLELRAWLIANELLRRDVRRDTDELVITDKGRVLVEAICATPMPVLKWVMA